jgi:hypothetical protein
VRSAVVYARLAIGSAFLSADGARFGLWDGTLDLEHFPRFIQLTAEVNSFMPAVTIPFLAWRLLLGYLYTPPGSKHSVRSETGCTLLFQVPEEVEIL